jgi:hypothetical protein
MTLGDFLFLNCFQPHRSKNLPIRLKESVYGIDLSTQISGDIKNNNCYILNNKNLSAPAESRHILRVEMAEIEDRKIGLLATDLNSRLIDKYSELKKMTFFQGNRINDYSYL